MKNLSFTKKDQLDKDGQVLDNIFTIVETKILEEKKQFSGVEVAFKILQLEKQITELEEELNFLKTLK